MKSKGSEITRICSQTILRLTEAECRYGSYDFSVGSVYAITIPPPKQDSPPRLRHDLKGA